MNKNLFDVCGISLQLTTPIDRFNKFITHNYSQFTTSEVATPDIKVTYSEAAGEYAANKKSKFRYYGGGIYVGNDSIYWENEYDFRVLVSICDDGTIDVYAYHHDLIGKTDVEERLKDFQRSMRWAVHFPLFTRLQYQRGWLLIHASAVVKNKSAIIFCGLNSIGKSTLSIYMSEKHGYELMTDNFLFIGDEAVFGFPEVVRLSPTAAEKVGATSIWNDLVYEKHHVNPSTFGTELKAVPEAFFFVNQGSKLATRKVDSTSTWETMQHLHSYLGEFPEHSYLGMWPYITGQTMNAQLAIETVTKTPWYELTYEPNWDLEAVVTEVKACI